MNGVQHRTMIVLSLVVALTSLVVYGATLTQVHTFDALSYILDVSRKPWQQLFHPHHLAYGPFGALIVSLARTDTAQALQWANAIAGSLGSAVLCAIIYRRWLRVDLALLGALSCAFSYAYWYYAVEVEVYTLATLCLLVVLWLVIEPHPAERRWRVSLAVALAGAVLFHQTNALLAIPLLVRAWPGVRTGGTARRGWLAAGAGGILLVAGAYLAVIIGVSGFTSYTAAHHWLFEYVDSGWWGGNASFSDVLLGLSDTLVAGWGTYIGIILVVLTTAVWSSTRTVIKNWWLLIWLMTYGVFFSWWEPDNIEFWIAVTPIAIILILTPYATLKQWDVRFVGAVVLLAVTFGVNLSAIRLRGDAQTDLQRDIARAVAAASQPADLVLVPDGLQELYLPYYQQREHFLSVNAAIAANTTWQAGCAQIRSEITRTHQAGAAVLMASDFLVPSLAMQQRYGLTPTAVTDCLFDILPLLEPVPMPAGVPAEQRVPTAGELLRAGHLTLLTGEPLGWTSANATTQKHATGWQIQVGLDPSVTSPLLDVVRPRRIVIDLAAEGTADRNGQLFVATAPNQFDEAHAVAWTFGAGRQRVVIDVTTLPDASHRLYQLRIDPVADGNGGIVTIYGISLE